MTQSTFFAENTGSKSTESPHGQTLRAAINRHLSLEKASFHTPGHKGRLALGMGLGEADLTELPGLDQLSYPQEVLKNLEARISSCWKSKESIISVNGASAALCAAVLAVAHLGSKLILPRNAHRAALNGLVISGLAPIWYEPDWLSEWNTWGSTRTEQIESALLEAKGETAAVLLCSPNYAGAISNVKEIAELCHKHRALLIVDEAHGAHLLSENAYACDALDCGADLVVHSFHKTLSAPTQTGALHIGKKCKLDQSNFRACLNLLQSSSPSYLFMLGVEKMIDDIANDSLGNIFLLADSLKAKIAEIPDLAIFRQEMLDPFHILLKHRLLSAEQFYLAMANKGIFAETVIGDGVLFLLGHGSTADDANLLLKALNELEISAGITSKNKAEIPKFEQKLNLREAFFSDSESLKAHASIGRISADWIAPCPPGHAIIAPGQEIGPEILKLLNNNTSIRVIKAQLEGDSDGPNTTS